MMHASPANIVRNIAELIRPPRRVSVSQAAEEHLVLNEPGGYQGKFTLDVAPYMREPMDLKASRRFEGVVFVGPARSLKTQALVDGGMAYTITSDPGDALIVQMSQESARDFSRTRVDRAIRHSPALKARLSAGRADDNVFDKFFKTGQVLKIGWPAVSQVSSKSIRWVDVTDYDRIVDDIEGEGSLWSLALKRTQTFKSRGMCCAESSPGREITDPTWRKQTPHEAPPCTGIIGLYNTGDRRRWYWPCPSCGEYSEPEPGISSFALPSFEELKETIRSADLMKLAARSAYFSCPHCGDLISEKHKREMNRSGRWLIEGQRISRGGDISGEARQSKLASFWLGGMPAAFQSWESICLRYLEGVHAYVTTGDETKLKGTTNLDQGAPYMPQRSEAVRSADVLIDRREEVVKHQIPEGVRFIVPSVDVQAGGKPRFVVQVHGYGAHGEEWLVDRYNIRTSRRKGEDGESLPVDPSSYLEDWELLISDVMQKAYRSACWRGIAVHHAARRAGGRSPERRRGRADDPLATLGHFTRWLGVHAARARRHRLHAATRAALHQAPLHRECRKEFRAPRHASARLSTLGARAGRQGVGGDNAGAVRRERRSHRGPGRLALSGLLDACFYRLGQTPAGRYGCRHQYPRVANQLRGAVNAERPATQQRRAERALAVIRCPAGANPTHRAGLGLPRPSGRGECECAAHRQGAH